MKQIKAILTPYLCVALLLCSVRVVAQERTCFTPTQVAPMTANLDPDPLNGDYCVTAYVEVDFDIVQDKGAGVTDFVEGMLGEVSKIYAAQDITVSWIIYYWDRPSPYTESTSGGLLDQFRAYRTANGGHDADVAHLLSYKASGGIAYVDVICRESFGYAFSAIQNTYRNYPDYSWNIEVIAHELGHNLGSNHTQACVWTVDGVPGQAIDGCSPFGTEGGCDNPGFPENGGTIMSYCHLQSSVGINFRKGFHPLTLAVIKNRIAAAVCTECTEEPDGPEPDTCDGNQIIVEIQLDNYPTETSWQVLDGQGVVVGSSQAFSKQDMNTYHADTLCLPDGCYSFVITDPDGITGYGCGEGLYIVNGPNGELASGQGFVNSETTGFCFNIQPPATGCDPVTLRKALLVDYANQSGANPATRNVTNVGNNGVEISGNYWQALPYEYEITSRTILTGEVYIDDIGEINGIALVPDVNGLYPDRTYQFAGTQAWGRLAGPLPLGGWHTFAIPVGFDLPAGNITHIVLVNDDDAAGSVQTAWRNLELCEGETEGLKQARTQVRGSAKDELGDGGQIGTFRSPYHIGTSCMVLHMDGNGNQIPCPGDKALGIAPDEDDRGAIDGHVRPCTGSSILDTNPPIYKHCTCGHDEYVNKNGPFSRPIIRASCDTVVYLGRCIRQAGRPISNTFNDWSNWYYNGTTNPYPNPATDTLNLPANEAWEVYNLQGVSKLSGSGQQAAIGSLKTGIYFIRQAGEVYTIVKR